jgi:hypothetical protein
MSFNNACFQAEGMLDRCIKVENLNLIKDKILNFLRKIQCET